MSHHHTPALPALPIKQFPRFKDLTRTDVIATTARITNIGICLLLMALVLRVGLSLFLISGPWWDITHTITQPFVAPFDNLVSSVSSMFQPGAMIAYCMYYTTYLVIAWSLKASATTRETL